MVNVTCNYKEKEVVSKINTLNSVTIELPLKQAVALVVLLGLICNGQALTDDIYYSLYKKLPLDKYNFNGNECFVNGLQGFKFNSNADRLINEVVSKIEKSGDNNVR